jgi:hypothetical protein
LQQLNNFLCHCALLLNVFGNSLKQAEFVRSDTEAVFEENNVETEFDSCSHPRAGHGACVRHDPSLGHHLPLTPIQGQNIEVVAEHAVLGD